MKFEIDDRIMSPFTSKLSNLETQILTITSSATIALFISILIAFVVFIIALLNLILDYKTRILEA